MRAGKRAGGRMGRAVVSWAKGRAVGARPKAPCAYTSERLKMSWGRINLGGGFGGEAAPRSPTRHPRPGVVAGRLARQWWAGGLGWRG